MSHRERPVIGLPIGRHLPDHPEYLRIRLSYPHAILAAGGVPLLIPPLDDPSAMTAVLDILDGIIFPGGLDVRPDAYGEAAHPKTDEPDEALDTLELGLARLAAQSNLPTLGICRGQQLVNVALGGSLIQDVPSELGLQHRQDGERWELSHTMRVEPGSRLASALGTEQLQVNSFHHQAVRTVAPGLKPVAWAPDGVIEGLESDAHPWLITVQFHPEELIDAHEPSQRIFRALIDACAERMRSRERTRA